ncbi:Glycosylphosphatidylinositol anchor attachment 1 protein, partial [Smittium culicis]
QNYWSKDIVFVFSDKGEDGIYKWLQLQNLVLESELNHKHRVSGLQAALSIELPPSSSYSDFALYYEGKNGQLPNLDLANIVMEIFSYNRFSTFHHGNFNCDLKSNDIKGQINRYLCVSSGLLENMKWLAFGTSVGTHAPFLEFRVDALTIRGIPNDSLNSTDPATLIRLGSYAHRGILANSRDSYAKTHIPFDSSP